VFIWDVQTLTIVYMTFAVYGRFWFSFMVMCMDMCMDVFGYVFGYVFGVMCMDTGSRSSARPGSINIGAYLSLGPVSIIIGTYSLLEAYHWDLLASRGPFLSSLGLTRFSRPH
jgi:hypothetical protein